MTEHNEVLSWILWNIEEDVNKYSTLDVDDLHNDYTDYCRQEGLLPASKNNAFSKVLNIVFPSARFSSYKIRKYYVKKKIHDANKAYRIPANCKVIVGPNCLEIHVPSGYIRNNEPVEWKVEFEHDQVAVSCMDSKLPLSDLGISSYAPRLEPYVSAILSAVLYVKFCKGRTLSGDEYSSVGNLDTVEEWCLASDSNSVLITTRSPSCKPFLPILGTADTCQTCRRFTDTATFYGKVRKNKRPAEPKQNGAAGKYIIQNGGMLVDNVKIHSGACARNEADSEMRLKPECSTEIDERAPLIIDVKTEEEEDEKKEVEKCGVTIDLHLKEQGEIKEEYVHIKDEVDSQTNTYTNDLKLERDTQIKKCKIDLSEM